MERLDWEIEDVAGLLAPTDADGSDLTLISVPAGDHDEFGDVWFGTHARMRPTSSD
jgi:hypothetical protein